MKKATLILMALVAMLSLAACSESNNPMSLIGNTAENNTRVADPVYLNGQGVERRQGHPG
ncbi:hypothetical protein GW813_11510 [bacterium]|nr:hypothetical protein [bacterium]PJA75403.1 MAG: hypothetical protein CO151_06570 [bacterium CG_4_9_14_3_um_filter_65_15]